MGIEEAAHAGHGLDLVAGELMFQHIDFVIEGHVQPSHQVLGLDVFLDAIGTAVESAFAPSGQVQDRFTEGFRWNGAGVDRDAPDPAAFFDHQDSVSQFCRLNGSSAPGRAAADDDEIVSGHDRDWSPSLLQSR